MISEAARCRIVIAGAGPAGSSLAIRLAAGGFDVTLVERERFPRHKLCGEFISPECLRHFAELGVREQMLSADGQKIYETRFFDRRGRSFAISSGLLDGDGFALSLSRYEMDRCLMDQARTAGVKVLEGTRISDVAARDGTVTGVTISDEYGRSELTADLFVDATGRAMALSKMARRRLKAELRETRPAKPVAVGFKSHWAGARIAPGTCEIFSFPGGYGGLTPIEGGMANLCFIMDARKARNAGSGGDKLLGSAVFRNARAAYSLEKATRAGDWLAVSINSFGRSPEAAAKNLLTVGDAAAFIDPFTGSGMLLALESSALLADALAEKPGDPHAARAFYRAACEKAFARRLRVSSLFRRAAFLPFLPSVLISFLGLSRVSRNYLAASTRSSVRTSPKMS